MRISVSTPKVPFYECYISDGPELKTYRSDCLSLLLYSFIIFDVDTDKHNYAKQSRGDLYSFIFARYIPKKHLHFQHFLGDSRKFQISPRCAFPLYGEVVTVCRSVARCYCRRWWLNNLWEASIAFMRELIVPRGGDVLRHFAINRP